MGPNLIGKQATSPVHSIPGALDHFHSLRPMRLGPETEVKRWRNGETTPDLFWPIEVVLRLGDGFLGEAFRLPQVRVVSQFWKSPVRSTCVSRSKLDILMSTNGLVRNIRRKPWVFFPPQISVFQGVPVKFPSTNSASPMIPLFAAGCIFDRHLAAGQTKLSCDMSADP